MKKNVTINEALKILKVDSIDDIDNFPKDFYSRSIFHVATDSAYLDASKSLGSFFEEFPISNASKAYRKGHSYLDFFKPHINSNYFLRLDIKSFFHTIPKSSIESMIFSHLKGPKKHEKERLTEKISNFLTIEYEDSRILPIGFPASPSVANLVFRPIDIQIEKLCLKNGISYSRYSDDLLFSSVNKKVVHSNWFESSISFIVAQLNMKLNHRKTIKTHNSISLNGYVISGEEGNKFISFSNKRLRLVRKLVYAKKVKNLDDLSILRKYFSEEIANLKLKYPKQNRFLKKFAENQVLNKLRGFRSYLISLLNYDDLYSCVQSEHRKCISILIEELNTIILSYDRG